MDFITTLAPVSRHVDVDLTVAASKAAAAARRAYLAHLYSMEYWETIGGVVGVLTILHLVAVVSSWNASLSKLSSTDTESGRSGSSLPFVTRLWRAFRSFVNILLYRVPIPLRFIHNLGSLAEVLCVFAYMGSCIAWSLMSTDVRVASNWSSRAGLMAATQIPFVISLAGKNSVVSYLTGLSYEKLNVIHRAAGRTIFIISWTHFGAKLWGFLDVYHESAFPGTQYKWGLVALICLTLATLSSFRAVRNRSYELFLMLHVILIFILVISILFHAPQMRSYVYPGFILWAFDRFARIFRLIFVNIVSSPHSTESRSTTTMERLSGDAIRISVRRARNLVSSCGPGQHFYIVAPGISNLPWEAHPFTAYSISPTIDVNDSSDKDMEIGFIIRGRNGFTRRLLQHIIDYESSSREVISTAILLDGPYGQPPKLGVFDTVILIAGGSGVSYTLSMLLGCLRQAKQGKGRTTRVLFIWAIRDAAHVGWIEPSLRAAFDAETRGQHPLDVDIRFFVTGYNSNTQPSITKSPEKNVQQSPAILGSTDRMRSVMALDNDLTQAVRSGGGDIVLEFGRPDLRKLLEEELAASDGRSVSVDVSGPGPLAGSVKSVLATSSFASPAAALRGGPNVTLHTETFGW